MRKISPDGRSTKTIFYNGDVEEVNVDEKVVKYYHAASGTWHSKYGDGLEIKEFPEYVFFGVKTTEITVTNYFTSIRLSVTVDRSKNITRMDPLRSSLQTERSSQLRHVAKKSGI